MTETGVRTTDAQQQAAHGQQRTTNNEQRTTKNDTFLRALRRHPARHTPVWFMRQAGRSLPEYRAIKEKYTLLEICQQPELCAEVTLQPVRRHGVDAAVMFADIMLPLIGIGVELEIVEAIGPVIARPVRDEEGVAALRALEPEEDVGFVLDSIRATLQQLGGEVPLIGFSGAPFTLASYLIEGRPSRDFVNTKRLMYSRPDLWDLLMRRLATLITVYAKAQVASGIHAFQLFDSWVGILSLDDYMRYVRPHTQPIFEALAELGMPTITFGTGTAGLLEAMRNTGGDAIGVDWRVRLDTAWSRIGHEYSIQGNLDPLVLLGPWSVVEREAQSVLDAARGRPGHIFNTGHGLHPETPSEAISRLVDYVHERTFRPAG